jgi:hypothetical protein
MEITHYVLDGHEVREAPLREWVSFFENTDARRVALDVIDNTSISTVFIGVDETQLFETMIFGGGYSVLCWRYDTWDEAMEGHRDIVARLLVGLPPRK